MSTVLSYSPEEEMQRQVMTEQGDQTTVEERSSDAIKVDFLEKVT